jgi:hypothetical protein
MIYIFMRKILEYSDYIENFSLSPAEQSEIRNWVKKYERYFNFHDTGNFFSSADQITDDVIKQLDIDPSKKDDVQSYINSLYDLSDGLSVVMSPDPQFQETGIDQLTRFQY